jgi:hypothetical protein
VAVRAELPASGGTQVKTIGDALMLRIPDPGAAILLGLRITHAFTRRLRPDALADDERDKQRIAAPIAAQRPARPQGNDPPRLSRGGPLRVPGSDRTAQPVAPGCLLQLAMTVWGTL